MSSIPLPFSTSSPGSSHWSANALQLRRDLQWIDYLQGTKITWVARDPLTLEFYYFSDLEKRFLSLLDGGNSIDAALTQLSDPSASPLWAQQLISRVEQAGLLFRKGSHGVGQGQRLWQRDRERSQNAWLNRLLNPVSIRIRLFDPNWCLGKLDLVASLLFGRWTCLTMGIMTVVVGWLVVMRLAADGLGVGISQGGLGVQWNWQLGLQLVIAFAVVKSLHELGHALACRYRGVECHEIGILFLLFMPCLYCDTSDSWKLQSRWQRASIAAAGIYVELILAMIAGAVWLITYPNSAVHAVAAAVMIAASMSTILVNANPLLRYDGYYIVSDVLGVPNLAQQGRDALLAALEKVFLGSTKSQNCWDASSWFLVPFALASWVYQTFVLGLIMIAAWTMFDQAGFHMAGAIVVGAIGFGFSTGIVRSLKSAVEALFYSSVPRSLRALGIGLLVAGLGVWIVWYQTWPTWISARGISEFRQLTPIYVRESGVLEECVDVTLSIKAGDTIAKLESYELEQELLQIESSLRYLEERIEQLKLQILNDDQAASKLGETVEQVTKLNDRRQIVASQINELSIKASHSGWFIPSENQASPVLTQALDRSVWRPLLDSSNLGCVMERGALLGWITPKLEYQVSVLVEQSDAELVQVGMEATVRWNALSSEVCQGQVVSVSSEPIEETPQPLIGDETFLSESNVGGTIRPIQPHYVVQLRLERQPAWLYHQGVGTVHIHTPPRTLWQSLSRQFRLNVRPN